MKRCLDSMIVFIKHLILFFIVNMLFLQVASAQPLYTERLFLAPEKENGVAGDTLWVEGQLRAADSSFSPLSRYVYLECINAQDSLLGRWKVVCDSTGYFQVGLPTQIEWEPGVYYVRGYTRWMQNFAAEGYSVVPFLMGVPLPRRSEGRALQVQVFPEGGRLVDGFLQNAAICVTDEDGFPIKAEQIFLLNNQNDTLARNISTMESGLGRLTFMPQPGETYRLQIPYEGQTFLLPLEAERGETALQAMVNRNRLMCRILSTRTDANWHLYLYHTDKGMMEIPVNAKQQMAVMSLEGFASGCLALFLTDTAQNVVSERLLWLADGVETGNLPVCHLEKAVYLPGESIHYNIENANGARIFARIVQADDLLATQAAEALHFGNDLFSPVRFPYLKNKEWRELAGALDNWLYTARFVRFPLKRYLAGEMKYPYYIEDIMLISGKAIDRKGKPFGPGLIDVQDKKAHMFYSGTIDEEGKFTVTVDDYPTGSAFRLTAKNRKGKAQDCGFEIEELPFPAVLIPRRFSLPDEGNRAEEIIMGDTSLQYSVDENNQKVYQIDKITVQSRRPVDIQEISRMPTNYIEREELEKYGSMSVRSMLGRFPAIQITRNGNGSGAGALQGTLKELQARDELYTSNRVTDQMATTREYGETTIEWKSMRFEGFHALGGGSARRLQVVVDGELQMGNIDYILDWSAGDIRSIELMKPTDTRCAIYNTPAGAILIETMYGTPESKEEKGQTIYPFGLSTSTRQAAQTLRAPMQPGKYRILWDIITPDKRIFSDEEEFEVK